MSQPLNDTVHQVTERIKARSSQTRGQYMDKIARAQDVGVKRAHLTCGNQAHAYAAMGDDKAALVAEKPAPAYFRRNASPSTAPFAKLFACAQAMISLPSRWIASTPAVIRNLGLLALSLHARRPPNLRSPAHVSAIE